MSAKTGARIFYAGIILLALGVALSLYSVPGTPRGNPPLTLPSFPLLEMQWSPIPLLQVISAILMAGGWIGWRHSLGPIMLAAVGLFLSGVVSEVLSFIYAITFRVDGATAYVMPYGTQPLELVLAGIQLGLFSIIFSWADYRQGSHRNPRI